MCMWGINVNTRACTFKTGVILSVRDALIYQVEEFALSIYEIAKVFLEVLCALFALREGKYELRKAL